MDPLTILVGVGALFASGKAVQSATASSKWKHEREEHADARARADRIIEALDRRSGK